jgi:hypothetical protein
MPLGNRVLAISTKLRLCTVTCLILLGACSQISLPKLKFAVPPDTALHDIAVGIAELAKKRGIADIELVLITEENERAYNLLIDQRADLALLHNSDESHVKINALLPVFTSVLHIFYKPKLDESASVVNSAGDIKRLFERKRVYAGGPGSLERKLLSQSAAIMQLDLSTIQFVPASAGFDADVLVIMGPISPKLVTKRLLAEARDFRLASLASLDVYQKAGSFGAVRFITPQIQSMLIPPRAYGPLNPDAVVTLGVTTLLAGRSGLDEKLIHDLVRMISEERTELAKTHPALFYGIQSDFDPSVLNFRTHQGSLDYINRDSPDIFERYAELWTLFVTLILATLSGIVAFVRWRNQAKKDRIDVYYQQLLELRERVPFANAEERTDMLACVKEIETRAYQQLIDEQLLADESFLIFLMTSSNVRNDLSQ